MVNAWRMPTELGIEIAHRIYLYLVQKYSLGNFLSVLFIDGPLFSFFIMFKFYKNDF